jgi:protoporphyrinogen oxidase
MTETRPPTTRFAPVAVVGAGPAGLTAAYALSRAGIGVEVFEAASQVGGMARSMDLWGHRVDLGPHRFFSKDRRVNRLWLDLMGTDYRMVERQTRILYRNRLYNYPLKAANALGNMGPVDAALCVLSYARARFGARVHEAETFEDWVVARFGRRLFEMFFKSYSEKLWGLPCGELSADFAAQRIKGFSLGQALLAMTGLGRRGHRTLTDTFAYPKAGNGEVYERMARAVVAAGGKVHLNCPVTRVVTRAGRATALELQSGEFVSCGHVVSTMPLTQMIARLDEVPPSVREAASRLQFRNTILVYLLVRNTDLFPDQWLYVHSPGMLAGRVTNFRNFVPELHGGLPSSVLAVEFWCQDRDAIWHESEADLIRRAGDELAGAGLLTAAEIESGKVVRVPRCYPVYGRGYGATLAPVVAYLRTIPNLWPVGRYGSFKYNNQDHSILMGLLAAENIGSGTGHDLWAVNSDDEYHEEESVITAHGLVRMQAAAAA